MRELTLLYDTQVLESAGTGPLLRQSGLGFRAKVTLRVHEPERKSYDHADLMVFPVDHEGRRFYILARDIGAYLNDPGPLF